MGGIGAPEILLILVIALIVLGPERMPKVARDLGRVVGDLRKTSDELRDEFLNADRVISKAIDVPASQPSANPGPNAPASEPAPDPAPSDEPPFDREMREARERLEAQRDG